MKTPGKKAETRFPGVFVFWSSRWFVFVRAGPEELCLRRNAGKSMRIPRCNEAYVSIAKLQDYLLSKTHPVGRSKAKFFRSLGFDETKTALLEARLLAIVRSEDYVEVAPSPHGTKYVVERAIQTPRGDGVQIRTVWIIETGENRPRFVTAYPV